MAQSLTRFRWVRCTPHKKLVCTTFILFSSNRPWFWLSDRWGLQLSMGFLSNRCHLYVMLTAKSVSQQRALNIILWWHVLSSEYGYFKDTAAGMLSCLHAAQRCFASYSLNESKRLKTPRRQITKAITLMQLHCTNEENRNTVFL